MKKLQITDEMLSKHNEKIKFWFRLLQNIMPEYFFKTFTTEQIQEIIPVLFNLRHESGIQQIYRNGSIIIIYLKNKKNNLTRTARMMKDYDIVSAAIHESQKKIIINGIPSVLVIEYYKTNETAIISEQVYSKNEFIENYHKKYKSRGKSINEIYDRINWNAVYDLSLDRLINRIYYALQIQNEDHIKLDAEKSDQGEIKLTMALTNCPSKGFYYKYIECLTNYGFQVQRAYLRKIVFQKNEKDFEHLPVSVNTLYIRKDSKSIHLQSRAIQNLLKDLTHIKWVTMNDLLHSELVINNKWSLAQVNLIRAAGEFIHTQLAYVDRHAYNNHDIFRFMALYPDLLQNLSDWFHGRFYPGRKKILNRKKLQKKIEFKIENIKTGNQEKDELIKTIYQCLTNFFVHIRKTNYYLENKTALSFRLDPKFMNYYDQKFPEYKNEFPTERPYGVFYFYRENGIGFHIRFSQIARGGWRTVIPKESGNNLEKLDEYSFTKDEIFKEVFILARTQHMKNKDIYEGGAKMICLAQIRNQNCASSIYEIQRAVCRAFLDLINYDRKHNLKTKNIVDLLNENEIIEIGPDENMSDEMIDWIGSYARKMEYSLRDGFISGKSDCGINHKKYGVTSFGVYQYLLKILRELNINPEQDPFSVKIAGGPFGDVAGNIMKMLLSRNSKGFKFPKLKIIAVTDGPAAAYDPDGLDKTELFSLIHKKNLDEFSPKKLKGENSWLLINKPTSADGNIESFKGYFCKNKKTTEEIISRDKFIKMYDENLLVNYADIFLPCGGRPATIHDSNWSKYSFQNKPSSKAIIEGANSYLTNQARNALQEKGVWIIKDVSANKCGVITSSYEILSGLILKKDEFQQNKETLVKQIMSILEKKAAQEAEWLFCKFRETGRKITVLSEELSKKINSKNMEISKYLEYNPGLIKENLILSHLPKFFSNKNCDVSNKIPKEYQEAVISVELASRIIYNEAKNNVPPQVESEIMSVLA